MKALVTGCAGFIGSHLCERLLAEKIEVIGIDALTDYYAREIKMNNMLAFNREKGFKFVEADLMTADLAKITQDADYIFHLAAQPGVRGSWGQNFQVYATNNILATQKLLESAKNSTRLKKFVYSSSSSIYGQIKVETVDEDSRTAPHSPYGATKLAGENLCFLYNANFGMPVVSLRLFTVYGPRQRPDMAFCKLIYAGISGESFPLYGDGEQERDFTFVKDVVQGMILAAHNDTSEGVFNIGGGHVVSMKEVIGTVEDILKSKIKIHSKPAERGDVRRTSADISKAKRELGFVPGTGLASGLESQAGYLKSNLGLYGPHMKI